MTIQRRNFIISIILAIIIIGLAWFLIRSIIRPYKVVKQRQMLTAATRQNMKNLRVGIIRYKISFGHYPPAKGGLDSVEKYLKSDTISFNIDSLMQNDASAHYKWNIDSLIYSPRPPHKKFVYKVNDSVQPPLYVLKDPGSQDSIGSISQITLLNSPSWK
jgi:hypothetical protein